MRRHFLRILLVSLVAIVAATATPTQQKPASAQTSIDPDAAKFELINEVYNDFLERDATSAEFDRFGPRVGVGQIGNDVRAKVLGSRAYLLETAGGTRAGFVTSVFNDVLDREPTAGELARSKRQLFRSKTSLLTSRQTFATQMLARAEYDPDDFAIRELVVHENAAGDIIRFAFETDKPFAKTDAVGISVSIGGNRVSGQMKIRAFENIVSLLPDAPIPRTGKIVAMVYVEQGDVIKVADLSAPANRLPARTVEPYPWPESVFDDQRVIAYYGNHLSPLLGVLGETGPEAAVGRVQRAAARFDAPDKQARGGFEMIVTVAQRSAGRDGNYSHPSKLVDVEEWIDIAEANGLYVILDIQPGRSDFLTESRRYEELLKRPNVHLALDPEWRMKPWQRPGQLIGQVSAAEVNQVGTWLSNLVVENDLPEKMFIIHQFQTRMITQRDTLIDHPGLATVIHADGFGGRAIKQATYGIIKVDPPFYNGFKLFIDEDTGIYQPSEVLEFSPNPVPDLVTYQ